MRWKGTIKEYAEKLVDDFTFLVYHNEEDCSMLFADLYKYEVDEIMNKCSQLGFDHQSIPIDDGDYWKLKIIVL